MKRATFVVSGGAVELIRAFAEQTYGIPPEQVTGSTCQLQFELDDMTNKVLPVVASTFEAVTGLALIITPSLARFLLETDISAATRAIVRIAGFGLLALGVACWPRVEANVPRLRAMLIYNSLATVYLGYLRFGSISVGKLLLPALAAYAVLAILFVAGLFQASNHVTDLRKSSYGH
jgi:uncharacterized protein YjeT (DUF2065 family)